MATKATGGAGLIKGTAGTVVSDGTLLSDAAGVLISVDGDATIGAGGEISGLFAAETEGEAGNLSLGTVLTFVTPVPGVQAQVVLTTGLSGGARQESDSELLERIYERFRNPAGAGKASDWRRWGKVPGITSLHVYAKRGGTGTVHMVVLQAGSGRTRRPSIPKVAEVDAAVAKQRPVTVDGYRTLAPYFDNGRDLTVRCRVVAAKREYWDWTTGLVGGYTVTNYAAGPPAVISFTGSIATTAPELKLAIDNARAGAAPYPRIQVLATGGPPIPVQVRCTNYTDGVTSTLTLEDPLPTGWAVPSPNDIFHPGGVAAPIIAKAVLDHLDSIGPARGKYADPEDIWEDTLYHGYCSSLATQATYQGLRLAKSATTTIAVGAGAASAQDVTALDVGGAPAPECLYARFVFATP